MQEQAPQGESADVTLVRLTASGDRSAFARLVERHRDAVYRYARLLAANREEAEDALQETFIRALRGAGGFSGEGSVRSWLLTIARNALLSARRRRVGQPAVTEDLDSLDELGARAGWGDPSTPEQIVLRLERASLLERALATLSAEDREVILARDLEQLSAAETAALLGLGLQAMKSRLHRARLRLVAALRAQALEGG